MNENATEKPFEPSASRLNRARREGNVARSQELTAVCAFGAALGGLAMVLPVLSATLRDALAGMPASPRYHALFAACGLALVPAFAGAVGATFGTGTQGGLRVGSLTVRFDRFNPIAGLRRMFSRDAASTAARASACFALIAVVSIPAVPAIFGATTAVSDVRSAALAVWMAATRIALAALGCAAAFAVLDCALQRRKWRRGLRMSFEELKRETKENEGDPLARSRRRSLHRELSHGGMHRVKDAAFVVTNPTHVAIALEYRPPAVDVPRVLVRAADAGAGVVKDLARRHGIPIVENVLLARALYRDASAGSPIPAAHYVAVAEVVAALLRAGVLT